jgi:hypothetical protein
MGSTGCTGSAVATGVTVVDASGASRSFGVFIRPETGSAVGGAEAIFQVGFSSFTEDAVGVGTS